MVIPERGIVNEPGQRRLILCERDGVIAWVLSLVSAESVDGSHGCMVGIGGLR